MMKKVWLILLAVTLVTCFFAACSSGGSSGSDPKEYTVTFDKNDGDTDAVPTTIKVTSPDTTVVSLPAPPTRSGYQFQGWNTAADGSGSPFDENTTVTANIKVYAQWRQQSAAGEYMVYFNKNGGDTEASPVEKAVVPPVTTIDALPTPPTRTGYTFAGWNTEANGSGTDFDATTLVNADIHVYAQWTGNTYRITCEKNGGDTDADPKVITVTVPNNTILYFTSNNSFTRPTRSGYIQIGWNTAENGLGDEYTPQTVVTADVTVYAQWELITGFLVTFDKDNANATDPFPAQKQVISPDTTIDALPQDPTLAEHAFDGWYTGKNGTGTAFNATTPVTANITVYAKWAAGFTVTFNPNGGLNEGSTSSVTKKVIPPAQNVGSLPTDPTRVNFEFDGWYDTDAATGGTKFTATTPVTADIQVYARWKDIHTVTFNKNNNDATGTTEANPQTAKVNDGAKITSLPTPPTRSAGWGAGMVFDSWNTKPDGSGTAFDTTTPVTDTIEVYAKWKFEAGTATVVGQELVHNAPALTTNSGAGAAQGTWAGVGLNTDGSITYSGGAIRYTFPNNLGDYDFFTVTYVSTKPDNETNPFKVIPKQFDTGDAYKTKNGTEYVDLTASGTLEFIISQATKGGIAFQFNTYGNNSSVGTIKIAKITFTKGTRHILTFDDNGATGNPSPASMTIVETVPFTLPTPTKTGHNFDGWKDASNNTITNSSNITTDLTLTAQWSAITATPQTVTVDFTSANLTIGGNSLNSSPPSSLSDITASGYTLTWGGGNGYGGTWVKFDVALTPGVTLSQYSTVTFTIQGVAGDLSYKQIKLLGDTNLGASASQQAPESKVISTETQIQYNNGTQNVTFNIKPGQTLTGTIQVSIFISCGNSSNNTNNGNTVGTTQFKFSNVKFNP